MHVEDEQRLSGFDERCKDRWWRWEKRAWIAMIVFVLAGAAGTFARGPLDRGTAQGDGIVVEYERIALVAWGKLKSDRLRKVVDGTRSSAWRWFERSGSLCVVRRPRDRDDRLPDPSNAAAAAP